LGYVYFAIILNRIRRV